MKRGVLSLMVAAALTGMATVAGAEPVIHARGLMVRPFAGLAAGRPALSAPKFGLIDTPVASNFRGLMYISELGGREVCTIRTDGLEEPYTRMVSGFTPQNVYGIDIDGPLANLNAPTMHLYAFPQPFRMGPFVISHGGAGPARLLANEGLPGWFFWHSFAGDPGPAQLQFDRTPGFAYGGFLYVSDWGDDETDGIYRVDPAGVQTLLCGMQNTDPRYFTFDITGGAGGYGPGSLWVSSFSRGTVYNVTPLGGLTAFAQLDPGIEGIAFGPGGSYFGNQMYVANLTEGTIDIVTPGGLVKPFASGFQSAAYIMFVTSGPYALYNAPTMYLADGTDSVWVIYHCPADFNDDGFLDFFDFDDFVLCFESENCPPDRSADFNNDGFVDFFDFDDFVLAFQTGC
jgi:hypothetical protein